MLKLFYSIQILLLNYYYFKFPSPLTVLLNNWPKITSVFLSTFFPWLLPTGGVACAACLMAHIIISKSAPSSSYSNPDKTKEEPGDENHKAGTKKDG